MTPTLLRHLYEVTISAGEVAKALGLPDGDWRMWEAETDHAQQAFMKIYRVEDSDTC
jgi:hypothetical protein